MVGATFINKKQHSESLSRTIEGFNAVLEHWIALVQAVELLKILRSNLCQNRSLKQWRIDDIREKHVNMRYQIVKPQSPFGIFLNRSSVRNDCLTEEVGTLDFSFGSLPSCSICL
jgi:hypothetical protein